MELLWNFRCVNAPRGPRSRGSPKCSLVASGVLVKRGYEPWGVGEKGQIMEFVIMENIFIEMCLRLCYN